MSRGTAEPVELPVRLAEMDTSLGAQGIHLKRSGSLATRRVPSEDSDQTAPVRVLI